jgi:Holliday junction resolvasome RuvABC endonuclease subunit
MSEKPSKTPKDKRALKKAPAKETKVEKVAISDAAAKRAWIDKNLELFKDLLKNKSNGYIIGVDFSLRSTGVIVLDRKGNLVHQELVKAETKDGTKAQRLTKIRDRFQDLLDEFKPCDVFTFEMISVMTNATVIDISMSAGLMLASLPKEDRPFLTSFSTTALKKAAIDDGKGDKMKVRQGVEDKWGETFTSLDLADAYVVARLGLDLISFADIYFEFRDKNEKDMEAFLLDIDKLRSEGFMERLNEAGIDMYCAQVIVSLLNGKGVSIENDYPYYKKALAEIFQ